MQRSKKLAQSQTASHLVTGAEPGSDFKLMKPCLPREEKVKGGGGEGGRQGGKKEKEAKSGLSVEDQQ